MTSPCYVMCTLACVKRHDAQSFVLQYAKNVTFINERITKIILKATFFCLYSPRAMARKRGLFFNDTHLVLRVKNALAQKPRLFFDDTHISFCIQNLLLYLRCVGRVKNWFPRARVSKYTRKSGMTSTDLALSREIFSVLPSGRGALKLTNF